ncbi:cytochrome b/b6 domain-containing protein [Microtetraspora malaysiensis]|uniref:cytochrome b/b6 domain-containing protein n=1 Tax=Microtetraspora malaysiensis TaxID=161358 RepID=UPI001C3F4C08|nr:cytochrome b/b6 domain-containing protein [Microtetraspora malaysiensis]
MERNDRRTRWFHAAVYLTVLVLLATGWRLIAGNEGTPSPLATLFGTPDTTLHRGVGWALAVLVLIGVVLGRKGVRTFVAESLRWRPGDARWLARWPRAVFTGRFAHHDGHFDPGQRLLNVVMVMGLAVLVGTGLGLVLLHGGPVFAVLDRVHRWATYVVTPLIAGHVLVASGVLPGYRGVWRSMHLGGRLDPEVARRLWPAWAERENRDRPPG